MIEALYQCSDEGLFFTEWQQNYETLAACQWRDHINGKRDMHGRKNIRTRQFENCAELA